MRLSLKILISSMINCRYFKRPNHRTERIKRIASRIIRHLLREVKRRPSPLLPWHVDPVAMRYHRWSWQLLLCTAASSTFQLELDVDALLLSQRGQGWPVTQLQDVLERVAGGDAELLPRAPVVRVSVEFRWLETVVSLFLVFRNFQEFLFCYGTGGLIIQ